MEPAAHLQDEDEVVGRLISGVQVMADVVFVVLVKLEFLNDIWVLEQPKQDLLRYQRRAELGNLCRKREDDDFAAGPGRAAPGTRSRCWLTARALLPIGSATSVGKQQPLDPDWLDSRLPAWAGMLAPALTVNDLGQIT